MVLQTSAKKLIGQIRLEIQKNKNHHLALAKLLLRLRSHIKNEHDFFLICEDEFGLAQRTAYQYLEVAEKQHVHKFNLDFSKLYLLAKLPKDKLEHFLKKKPIKKIQKLSVRELEKEISTLREAREPINKPNIRLVVDNTKTKNAVELTKDEKIFCNRIEEVLIDINEVAPVSDALKERLQELQEQIQGLINSTSKNYLTQNRKMEKMSGRPTFNWAIPSNQTISGIKTCPNAATCAKGCYAVTGLYRLPRNQRILKERFNLSLSNKFVQVMTDEIKRRRILRLRIHDSGDFYSKEYLEKWLKIARENPGVEFYTYTKMISLLKKYKTGGQIPANFKVVYSFGGTEDHLIDQKHDLHSEVFISKEELIDNGYEDAHNDDAIVLRSTSNKIGLIHHGPMKYGTANWSKAKRKKAA